MNLSKLRSGFLAHLEEISPAWLFFITLATIFIAEFIVTYVVYDLDRMPVYTQSILDIFFTTSLVFITLYVTLFRPMSSLMDGRKKAIEMLHQEHNQLEQTVQERTAELADAYQNLQLLSRRVAETQEEERRNLSRELHDGFGQALTSVMVKLTFIEQQLAFQQSVNKEFSELYQLLQEMLEDIHRIAIGLHPASLDQLGLVAALRQYLETIQAANTMKIEFASLGISGRLPYEIEISLFRIAQEAVTNVIRHARATRIDVLLEKQSNRLVMVVEDDGVGFDLQGVSQGKRLGVYGMGERAEMLGGKLSIESQIGHGTTVQVEIPYANTTDDCG